MNHQYASCWILFLLLLGIGKMYGQGVDNWEILADTKFVEKYFEEENTHFLAPEFGERILDREGKSFSITGFLIPVDPGNNEYILSKYPYASCFFCGAAGPESVIELELSPDSKEQKSYHLDAYLTFTGTLRLNSSDIFRMNFILENAVEVKE